MPSSPLPLTVVTSVDPVLRDSLVVALVTGSRSTVVLRHDLVDDGAGGRELRRVVIDAHGVVEDVRVPLEHACSSCALREDAVPTLGALAASGRWEALALVLPVSAASLPAARALGAATRPGEPLAGVRLASVAAGVDLRTATQDLLGDDLLADRGLELTGDDRRAVGEALAAQLAHADVVVTLDPRQGSQAGDLVDHLRAGDSARVDGLHDLDVDRLLTGAHDVGIGEARLDPLLTAPVPAGSPSGVWTVTLTSDRPFHPERLLAGVHRLATGRLRGRGVFWVANRPDTACAWDGAGGQLSIGPLGPWGARPPVTRLVVTGVDDDIPRLRQAFRDLLLTDEEVRRGLGAWLGRDDVLEPWLGVRTLR